MRGCEREWFDASPGIEAEDEVDRLPGQGIVSHDVLACCAGVTHFDEGGGNGYLLRFDPQGSRYGERDGARVAAAQFAPGGVYSGDGDGQVVVEYGVSSCSGLFPAVLSALACSCAACRCRRRPR